MKAFKSLTKSGTGIVSKVLGSTLLVSSLLAPQAFAEDTIKVGFAVAQTGWMTAYDGPAVNAAKIKIQEINENGGLLGKQLEMTFVDTKSDRAEGAKAGAAVVDQDVDMVVVSCDYDFGAPAAIAAQEAGKISFFLCAEDVKAGIVGVGNYSFSASILAAVQGATMAEWSYNKRKARKAYMLVDTSIEYSKSVCYGFDWMFSKMADTEIIGKNTFKNSDPSIASQITEIRNLKEKPDAIMICSYNPGGGSAIKQLRDSGIDSLILSSSSMDGTYWLTDKSLSNFVVPVQGSIHGDDPNPNVEIFNQKFNKEYGHRPSSTYAYPGYIMVDLWAKAVERAGTTETEAVVAELEKFRNEPTLFGPRTFTNKLHHQDQARYLLSEATDGEFKVVDEWTISEPVPVKVMFGL